MSLTIKTLLVQIVNLFLGVVSFFLGMRILLRLLSANSATPFVAWIYAISERIIYPFKGIFGDLYINGVGAIDMVGIISLLAYSAVAYFVITLIGSSFPGAVVREDGRVVV